jgi:hypothetical protein
VSREPEPTPKASVSIDLTLSAIPAEFTTPALAYETDGSVLLWSSGAPGGPEQRAAHLWFWAPGSGQPTRAFVNPNLDSSLTVIRSDGMGQYAFVEQNSRLYGPAGWRLWYLRQAGGEPELIDEGDVEAGLLPFPTMTEERVVWAVLHESERGVQSQLLEWRVDDGKRTILLAANAKDREYLYPSVLGTSLAYTTIDANAARTRLSSAVWLYDLSDHTNEPVKVSGDSDAFMGVLGDGIVVWQSPSLDNPFNGGTLVLHHLDDGTTEPINVGGPVTWHTVGRRFVIGQTEDVSHLYGYDLQTSARVLLDTADTGPPGTREAVDARPRVGGDLLVFVRGSDNQNTDLILEWAQLPTTSE